MKRKIFFSIGIMYKQD